MEVNGDLDMTEMFKCFVYGIEVQVIEGICQEDCSIEECNLNRDNHQGKEMIKEISGSDDQ